jgi:hypothetical protein
VALGGACPAALHAGAGCAAASVAAAGLGSAAAGGWRARGACGACLGVGVVRVRGVLVLGRVGAEKGLAEG